MKFFKKVFFLSLILALAQCKSHQVEIKPNEMKYADFTSRQKKWKSPDGEIAYIDKGEGTPLLLLHGIPTSGWLYRKIIDPLADKGYRVIVPDMLGFGNSDSPEGYDIYDKKAHAKRIIGLMDSLGIDNWHHVMHDAGGLWTWELAKINPAKFNKMSILNTIIYAEGFKPPIKVKKDWFGRFLGWLYRSKTHLMLRALFKEATNNHHMSREEMKGYATPLKQKKTESINKFFTTNTESIPDYSPVLKSINVPVQVIWGKDDSILLWHEEDKRVMDDLKIDPKNVHVLEKNHFLQEEASKELIQLIGAFK